jgi:hypothetical protein
MKSFGTLILILPFLAPRLEASVLYQFADAPGGVQLTYSGSINTSVFSDQGGLGSNARFIDINGVDQPSQPLGPILYEFENFQPSPLYPFPGDGERLRADGISYSWNMTTAQQQYTVTSAYGDTFGFYIYRYLDHLTVYVNVPVPYTSGAPINGGMFFAGQTLSSMGLSTDESFQVFLPGNQTISGIVVPEPGAPLILLLAVGCFLGRRWVASGGA